MATLRDFDKEGYGEGGPKWFYTRELVKKVISEDLNYLDSRQKSPKKWFRKVVISDKNKDVDKIRKIGGIMSLLATWSAQTRMIRDVARAIIRAYEVPPKDYPNEFWAVQHWIQNNIRYVFDDGEQFQTPVRTMLDWFNDHEGADCDCMSMLYLSFMRALGHRRIAVGLLDSKGDGVLSHAIGLVAMPRPQEPWGSKWIAVELTKKQALGWITPKASKLIAIPVVKWTHNSKRGANW